MREEIFIENYLNKSFMVTLETKDVTIRDKFSSEVLSYEKFFKAIRLILGDFITPDGHSSMTIVESWIKAKLVELTAELKEFLSDCQVVLTKVGWDVYKPKFGEISPEYLSKIFEDKFSLGFLEEFYDDWYGNRICTESERIMNIF